MIEARSDDGTATVLADGTVLEVGGPNGSAELYDPSSNAWTSIAKTHVVHGSHTATLLKGGTVLIAGGNWQVGEKSSEVYDPATEAWAEAPSMAEGRWGHSAALLADGRVLVVGGFRGDGSAIASAEIYDPSAGGSWSPAGSLPAAAGYQSLAQLSDGRVLVAGGQDGDTASKTAAIFDPTSSAWTPVGELGHARGYATAVHLANDMVLIAGGGANDSRLSSAELFDPASLTWSDTGEMTEPRSQGGAVVLADGRALVVGGGKTHNPTAETYDPSSGNWSPTGPTTTWRASPQVTLLEDGRVFVLGGFTDDSASTEFFDARAGGAAASRPPWFGRCDAGCQGPISAGTFTSSGFLPGLSMTLGDGWFNTADYPDEIQLEQGDNVLRFWRNIGAITPMGEPIQSVAGTPEGLTAWLTTNPNVDASEPRQTTVGGVPATTLTATISMENVNVDPGCPAGIRSCLRLLWIKLGHDFAIGYGEAVRLYFVRVRAAGEDQTITVSLDAPSGRELSGLTTLVEPVLESLYFPD